MAYGFATHLWLHGNPGADAIREWVLASTPGAAEHDVVAVRLGQRTLLAAVNTAESEARWRSIALVKGTAAHVRGCEWTSVDLRPDDDYWRIEQSSGGALEWDAEAAGSAEDPPPSAVERAKEVLRSLVPLPLVEVHHYVDWGQEMEDTPNGAPAPALPGVTVQRFELGLPVPVTAAARGSPAVWMVLALCMVASAFTVSITQPPGPGAFLPRFMHFTIEGTAFWALAAFGVRLEYGTLGGLRLFAVGLGVIAIAGAIWGLVPI